MGNSNSGIGSVEFSTTSVPTETSNLSTQLIIWAIVGFIVFELICIFCLLRYCCCRAHSIRKKHYKEREIIIREEIKNQVTSLDFDNISQIHKSDRSYSSTQPRSAGIFDENRRIAEKIIKADERSIRTKSDLFDENDREINVIYAYNGGIGSVYDLPTNRSKPSSVQNFKLSSRIDDLDNLDNFELTDNISPRQATDRTTTFTGIFNPYDQYDKKIRYSRQVKEDNNWEMAQGLRTVDWDLLKEETFKGNGFRYAVVNEPEIDEDSGDRYIEEDRFIKGRIFGRQSTLVDKAVNCRLSPTSFVESEVGISRIGHESKQLSVYRDNDWLLNLDSVSNKNYDNEQRIDNLISDNEFVSGIDVLASPESDKEDFRPEENMSYENLIQASKSDILNSQSDLKLTLTSDFPPPPPSLPTSEPNTDPQTPIMKGSLRSILKKRAPSISEISVSSNSRPPSSSLSISIINKMNDANKEIVIDTIEQTSIQPPSMQNFFAEEISSKVDSPSIKKFKSRLTKSNENTDLLSQIRNFKRNSLRQMSSEELETQSSNYEEAPKEP